MRKFLKAKIKICPLLFKGSRRWQLVASYREHNFEVYEERYVNSILKRMALFHQKYMSR